MMWQPFNLNEIFSLFSSSAVRLKIKCISVNDIEKIRSYTQSLKSKKRDTEIKSLDVKRSISLHFVNNNFVQVY